MKLKVHFLIFLGISIFAASSGASIPPAGYRISNTSRAEYIRNSSIGISYSNEVMTQILPIYAIDLRPKGTINNPAYSLQGFGGDTLYCDFLLSNRGNTRDSVAMDYSILGTPGFVPEDMVFFKDTNLNGQYDPGEEDPYFLALDMSDSVTVSLGVVLPDSASGNECYEELEARSTLAPGVEDASVIKTTFMGPMVSMLYIGPESNPKALPGGEGSIDDVTSMFPSINQTTMTFTNEILNENSVVDVVEIGLANRANISPELTVSFTDTVGNQIPQSPVNSENFFLGVLGSGERRKIRVTISSGSKPLRSIVKNPYSLPVAVMSVLDSQRVNTTIDRIEIPDEADQLALLSLRQTFRHPVASTGDVVTLVIKVQNISDSVLVDSVIVDEFAQAILAFKSSSEFSMKSGRLFWSVGTLAPGEEKQGSIRFICNGRMSRGKTRAIGSANGISQFGDNVTAGPVESILAIENDVFASEGMVFGAVFIDSNGNGSREEDESGVRGVAIYLDSGEYALTDSSGRFTIPRAFAGYRLVRIDESSIPPGMEIAKTTQRAKSSTLSRLVHILGGGNASVTFPLRKLPGREAEQQFVIRKIVCQEKTSFQKKFSVLFKALSIPSSFFETGKAYMRDSPLEELRQAVPFILSHSGWNVFLEGHTDSIPIHTKRFPSNYELSIARAETVKRFLAANGLPEDRIFIKGYGESRPLTSNSTSQGRRLNRRVDVNLVPPGVDISRPDALLRVKAEMSSMSEVADSLQGKIIWSLSTDSQESLEARLNFDIPKCFQKLKIKVTQEGNRVEWDGSSWIIKNFIRSRGLDIEVTLITEAKDTSQVRRIRARLTVERSGPSGDQVAGILKGPRLVEFSPFQGGDSRFDTKVFELLEWKEQIKKLERTTAISENLTENPPSDFLKVVALQSSQVMSLLESSENLGKKEGSIHLISRISGKANAAPNIEFTNSVALLSPEEGHVFSKRDRITVTARVPLGSKYNLICDGIEVLDKQIGEKKIFMKGKYEEVSWYGVKLRPGWNKLLLHAWPLNGSRLTDSLQVALAGKPRELKCQTQSAFIPADGRSTTNLRFEVNDDLGLPVVDGLVATVVAGDSMVSNKDARPEMRGLQVLSSGGFFNLRIRGMNSPGRRKLVIQCGEMREECMIAYVPPARPLLVSGIIEARLGAFNATGSGSSLGIEDYHDGLKFAGLSRLFLQGTTYGGMNLTLRLDSKKKYRDQLLKTINPERQYPIYGDASELHFAAPAQGGNYVALEKGESFVRYGDFKTSLSKGEFLTYRRAATGVDAALTTEGRSFRGFITKTDFTTHKDEISADGTSGYYYLTMTPVVENSEKIIIETRDRYQPERIIEVRPLVQNRDYTFNYFDGSLLFKEPIPATDVDFNPVYIVAIYEVSSKEAGEKARYLYGARGGMDFRGKGDLQLAAVSRQGAGKGYTLLGARGKFAWRGLIFSNEVARSEDEIAGNGNAFKSEVSINTKKLQGSFYYRRIDGGFINPSFSGATHELGSRKTGFGLKVGLNRYLDFISSGYRHRFFKTGDKRGNAEAIIDFDSGQLGAQIGLRAAEERRGGEAKRGLLNIVGLSIKKRPIAFSSKWEKNVLKENVGDYPDRLRSSLTVSFLKRYSLVASHEYLTSLSRGASHQSRLGLESKLGKAGSAYAKYSLNRTASYNRLGAVTGLKQRVVISKGLSGNFGLENFHSLSKQKNSDYLALRMGLNSSSGKNGFIEGQYELRWQRASSRHLFRSNFVHEFSKGLALLSKNAISFIDNKDRNNAMSCDCRAATAFRSATGRIKNVFMLRNIYEKFSPVNPEGITWKFVLSTDLNVRLGRAYELRFKYGAKYVEDYDLGVSTSARTQLFLSQFIYEFYRVWDVDTWGRLLYQSNSSLSLGCGIEVGRIFHNCIRIAAGYSLNGFKDMDFSENDAWAGGVGVRVQFIVSEWFLKDMGF